MIGDVNLFLPKGVEEDVECEIMIAGTPTLSRSLPLCSRVAILCTEKEYRGKGVANEALSLLYALPLKTAQHC
jgi:predicted GNAT family acetyltransferase